MGGVPHDPHHRLFAVTVDCADWLFVSNMIIGNHVACSLALVLTNELHGGPAPTFPPGQQSDPVPRVDKNSLPIGLPYHGNPINDYRHTPSQGVYQRTPPIEATAVVLPRPIGGGALL
jgi:hypothetical protein